MTDTDFALNVWHTLHLQDHRAHARRLWGGDWAGVEDGRSETLCRAIAGRSKFNGRNLGGWLHRIMRNVRYDQLAKGGRKGKAVETRLVFAPDLEEVEDLRYPLLDLCDPESILIATEQFQ